MTKTNTKIGSASEKSVSSLYRERGYWVYNCPKSLTGAQPVDLIAIKKKENYIVWFADSKHLESSKASFTFDRIEPNQIASLTYLNNFAGVDVDTLGFVIDYDRTETYYWLPFEKYLEMNREGAKSVKMEELEEFEKELDKYE